MQGYRRGLFRKGFDVLATAATAVGVPTGVWLLTTRGRKTGLARTNPVRLVAVDGRRWLVAPYGPVAWVHNARSAGTVEIARGRRRETCSIREATPEEAGRVLKHYVRVAPVVLPYFEAGLTSSAEDFEREAAAHPVFELRAVS